MLRKSLQPVLCLAFISLFPAIDALPSAEASAAGHPDSAVFGPETCIRGEGGPVLLEYDFTTADPERVFILDIVNGGLEDDEYEKVSSSEITLNGVLVLGPNNFNKNVGRLSVPLSLNRENVLGVEVRGKPGGAITITIEPALTIDVPEAGQVFGAQPIEVSGRAFSQIGEVSSGGMTGNTGGGLFLLPEVALDEGPNTLCVTASWADGMSAEDCVEVTLDTNPPVVMVDNPVEGHVVNLPSIDLSGSVMDDVSLQSAGMTVNDSSPAPLVLDGEGRFDEIVNLVVGENTISVRAVDSAGNESVVVRSVVFQPGGSGGSPITILSPADGDVINARRVDVYGTYRAPVEQIQVWSMAQVVGDGKFYIPGMPIGEGATTITVRGEDGERNRYEAVVEVVRTSSEEPVEVVAEPQGGPAPLTVTLSLENNTGESITKCEADFLGTGVYVPLPECVTGISHTYEREQLWQPSFRVTTADGHRFTAFGTASVHGPAVFESAYAAEDPVDLDIDGDGKLYVLEGGPARVRVVGGDGADLTVFGTPGSGPGEFSDPSGISVDGEGRIYVSDTGNDRVQVFAPDGAFLESWGYPGSRIGEIRAPRGIDVRHDGDVAMANTGNGRASLFRGDGYFEADSCAGELTEPWDVAWSGVDIAVTDRAAGTVKICPRGAGSPIPWDGNLPPMEAPRGITYDAGNRSIVAPMSRTMPGLILPGHHMMVGSRMPPS